MSLKKTKFKKLKTFAIFVVDGEEYVKLSPIIAVKLEYKKFKTNPDTKFFDKNVVVYTDKMYIKKWWLFWLL